MWYILLYKGQPAGEGVSTPVSSTPPGPSSHITQQAEHNSKSCGDIRLKLKFTVSISLCAHTFKNHAKLILIIFQEDELLPLITYEPVLQVCKLFELCVRGAVFFVNLKQAACVYVLMDLS